MQIITVEHPAEYRMGTRVLILKGRHKDGVDKERTIIRVSHDATQFNRNLDELLKLLQLGERIYGSASSRNLRKAVRLFKERQALADYDTDTDAFYKQIEGRWASCLLNPRAQDFKLWLIDCDSLGEMTYTKSVIERVMPTSFAYWYKTKNGWHCVTNAFNRNLVSADIWDRVHQNALMLWAWVDSEST